MPRKSNKKSNGAQFISNAAAAQKIEDDFAKTKAKIEAQMNLLKRFEKLVSMKITTEFCPGCELFLECSAMKYHQMFSKISCNRSVLFKLLHPEALDHDEIFAIYAQGITVAENLSPVADTFS